VQHNADPANVDPVHALMEDLSQEAQTSKRAAAKYEQIRKDADLPPDFDPTAAISAKAGFSVPKQPVTRLRSPRRSIVY
jgi:hypothetical protein